MGLTPSDSEGLSGFAGILAALVYLQFCDSIRLRYSRSLGKAAFDLRPVKIMGPDRGKVGKLDSARRNTWKLLVLTAVVTSASILALYAVDLVNDIESDILKMDISDNLMNPFMIILSCLVVLTGAVWIGAKCQKRRNEKPIEVLEKSLQRRRKWAKWMTIPLTAIIAISAILSLGVFFLGEISGEDVLATLISLGALWSLTLAPFFLSLMHGRTLYPITVIDADSDLSHQIDAPPRYQLRGTPGL